MGLILDTCVFLDAVHGTDVITFSHWQEYGSAYMSVITVSELLVGVNLATNLTRLTKRETLVKAIIDKVPVLPFTEEVTHSYAKIYADLAQKDELIDSHSFIIAATALRHDYAILTKNKKDFAMIPKLKVVCYAAE